MPRRVDRAAIKSVSPSARGALGVISCWETEEFTAISELCRLLEMLPLRFVTFSCLGTKKGKEELKVYLHETFFWRYRRNVVAERFLSSIGVEFEFLVILPDMEPIRTWGWGVPQEEVSGYCQMMIEDELAELPPNWKVVLWSEIETKVQGFTYENALTWARKSAHPLVVKEEALHLLSFSEILTRGQAEDVALRQVAAYAFEGWVLEHVIPNAILLQSEFPIKRKDKMYQPLRQKWLPVVHPFPLP